MCVSSIQSNAMMSACGRAQVSRELFGVDMANPWVPFEEYGLNKRGALVWVSSGLMAAGARLVVSNGACRRAVPGVSRTCLLA